MKTVRGLERTHIIKKPRRPPEGPLHDFLPGGYGNPDICAAARTDGQICGLSGGDRRQGEHAEHGASHWCQPAGYMSADPHPDLGPEFRVDDSDRQPCTYCGVPLVRVDKEWCYASTEQVEGETAWWML